MEDASLRRSDANPYPTDILGLNQEDNDIFLDIFSNFYAKIVEALSRKSKKIYIKTQSDILTLKVRNMRPNILQGAPTVAVSSVDSPSKRMNSSYQTP